MSAPPPPTFHCPRQKDTIVKPRLPEKGATLHLWEGALADTIPVESCIGDSSLLPDLASQAFDLRVCGLMIIYVTLWAIIQHRFTYFGFQMAPALATRNSQLAPVSL